MLTLTLLFLTGLVAGVLAGLLGIGGGLIMVPAVSWLLMHQGAGADFAVPVAVATSLGSMLLTSLGSMAAHHRLGGIDWPCAYRLGASVALGALFGAGLALMIGGAALSRVFAIFAAVIGLRMLMNVRPVVAGRDPRARAWWLAGPGIGAISAMVGIGGGSLNVPYLARNGYAMANAVAIAAVCGFPIAFAGSAGFFLLAPERADWPHMLGYWYWPGVLTLGLAGMLSAPLGARLAHRLPAKILRRLFGVVLIMIALRMAL